MNFIAQNGQILIDKEQKKKKWKDKQLIPKQTHSATWRYFVRTTNEAH